MNLHQRVTRLFRRRLSSWRQDRVSSIQNRAYAKDKRIDKEKVLKNFIFMPSWWVMGFSDDPVAIGQNLWWIMGKLIGFIRAKADSARGIS